MLEFAWPWVFLLLPLPLAVWWLLPPYRARQASVQVPFFVRLAAATGQTPQRGAVVLERRASQMVVAAAIWILLVAALARPQWVGEPVTREVSARDLILAIDISGSMDQRDFKVTEGATLTRLDGVKRVIRDFIARRKGDRIALILFGTKAYVQVPFTQDLETAEQLLDQAAVGMAGQQTAIGDTIGLAIETFAASTANQKLLVLLTDGNDTASRVPPEHAADIARQADLDKLNLYVTAANTRRKRVRHQFEFDIAMLAQKAQEMRHQPVGCQRALSTPSISCRRNPTPKSLFYRRMTTLAATTWLASSACSAPRPRQ